MDGIAPKTALNTGGKIFLTRKELPCYYALFHPCAALETAPEIKTISLTCGLAGVHAVELEVNWTF
jgi:hypothetical protein